MRASVFGTETTSVDSFLARSSLSAALTGRGDFFIFWGWFSKERAKKRGADIAISLEFGTWAALETAPAQLCFSLTSQLTAQLQLGVIKRAGWAICVTEIFD